MRREASARRRHRDDVGHQTERRQILDDLAADGALTGDHQRIVIGRHQHGVSLARDGAGNGLAIVIGTVKEHDLRAQRRRAGPLAPRRVRRHHDDGGHAQKPRRGRDALRMVAGRERDHAAGALFVRYRGQLVIGAAKLERAGALQRLGLEKHPRAGQRVERRASDEGGPQRDARQELRRRVDIPGGGQEHWLVGERLHRPRR